MPRGVSVRVGAAAASCLALLLAACTPRLPDSVVEGATVTVGWSEDLTSLNAAASTGATHGNREIASMTRDQFARVVDGAVEVDEGFGTVEVTDPAPDSFTVRYDLAERQWSDGIPVDAADLLLAWAAGSNALEPGHFDSGPSDLTASTEVPSLDEFERRVDVRYATPVRGWHTALDVAVPAHVVGMQAFDIDDAMEAKQAVITAIQDRDGDDLATIAEEWNNGFDLGDEDGDISSELSVSSGPYRVEAVERGESGTKRVRLVVNREYAGDHAPAYEEIALVAAAESDRLDEFGDGLGIVQVRPTEENFEAVRALERRDHHVATSHHGQVWALVLRADRGVFRSKEARLAFLRAVPRSDLRSAGAGAWQEAYASTDSVLFDPGSAGYSVAIEDAGLRQTFEAGSKEEALEREQAGVAAGTSVCVLHDTGEAFAARAFAELKTAVAEAGWRVRDCGADNVQRAVSKRKDWNAVLTTVPVPQSPREIAGQWGSEGAASLSGSASKQRDRVLGDLAHTADPYVARDLKVALETLLVSDAVALPIAVDPVVTVANRGIDRVQPASGRSATLLSGAAAWGPAD